MRRTYGLLLEASDVVIPIARRLFGFVQEGLQLLLVLVIGRGLGLVLRGIRESVNGFGQGGAGAGTGAGDKSVDGRSGGADNGDDSEGDWDSFSLSFS